MLYLLQLTGLPIFEQLQLEEALLRADERSWCLINQGTPTAIVMGISGKAELLIDQTKLERSPIPVIRRFSGGGTVVVDENTLFVTLICNKSLVDIPAYPDKVMSWSEGLYRPIFDHPDFRLAESDYAFGEKKFGGNAQYIRKERWLHHSSLLWDFDPQKMEYLQLPQRTPAYRKKRAHNDFLCRLCEFYPSREEVLKRIKRELNSRFEVQEVELNEAKKVLELPHRQATCLI